MQFLTELWLPILLTAVGVYLASCLIWMFTPLHKKDHLVPPDETDILAAIEKHGFKPGQYCLPWCTGADWKDPAFLERLKRGPWAWVVVMEGPPSFARALALWFPTQVLIALLTAYAAWAAIGNQAGLEYLRVFQVVGSIAFLAHGGTMLHDHIWKGASWRLLPAKAVDALVYALLTAGVFAWMWPGRI
ncbi:MAG: hypothetical protein KF866_11635 [Phycisphaeraceae bacterium]|nr:hypothetical protein [Phycisphaeraceae bacterium]MCW5755185.1 hypothetical protein [Phycisphaeraceae bacterium]